MRNWKPVGDPKSCEHDVDLQFAKDRLVFTVARSCIGTPDTLRVGAKMTDQFDASHPVHDWMKGPRRWTGYGRQRLTAAGQPAATRVTATAQNSSPMAWCRWTCSRSTVAARITVNAG